MKILILILCLGFTQWSWSLDLETVELNKEGANLLKQQNFTLAQEKFLKALSLEPFLGALHLNLGLALEGQGQVEKAVASYLTAAKYSVSDPRISFVTFFNLGQLYGKDKKIDEALAYYQMALDLKPDSIETKTNIELLIQQGGGGKGASDDKDKDKDDDKNKDKKDQDKKDQKNKDAKEDKKDDKSDKDKEEDKNKDKPKEYEKNKPQPKKFKSEELNQGDVNKILGEIKQQEQKIRQDYNRKDMKERPRDKDW